MYIALHINSPPSVTLFHLKEISKDASFLMLIKRNSALFLRLFFILQFRLMNKFAINGHVKNMSINYSTKKEKIL